MHKESSNKLKECNYSESKLNLKLVRKSHRASICMLTGMPFFINSSSPQYFYNPKDCGISIIVDIPKPAISDTSKYLIEILFRLAMTNEDTFKCGESL